MTQNSPTERPPSTQTAMINYFLSFPDRKGGCIAGEQGTAWWPRSAEAILTEGVRFAESIGVIITLHEAARWHGVLTIEAEENYGVGQRIEYEAKLVERPTDDIISVRYTRYAI